MGQFDRVAFKQCGETLFDELFEFDRQLKDTMAYANTQKNGSLNERLEINAMELRTSISSGYTPISELANQQPADIEKQDNILTEQIHINITDDVDDEAVYGKNRHRRKGRER
jgi:hypothetical protein